jgi:hypothetical protein
MELPSISAHVSLRLPPPLHLTWIAFVRAILSALARLLLEWRGANKTARTADVLRTGGKGQRTTEMHTCHCHCGRDIDTRSTDIAVEAWENSGQHYCVTTTEVVLDQPGISLVFRLLDMSIIICPHNHHSHRTENLPRGPFLLRHQSRIWPQCRLQRPPLQSSGSPY